jgi:alpha-amylase/alpha-mannosidase (GH57 family)
MLDYGWHDPEGKYEGWSDEEREKEWWRLIEVARENTRKIMARVRKPTNKKEE